MAGTSFDVTHGANAAREPLVAEGAGGGKGKMIGIGVGILIALAVVGGAVVWLVMGHHGGGSTTPLPAPDPSIDGGAFCAQANGDGDCEQCEVGHILSNASGVPNRCFYKCESDLLIKVVNSSGKGLCLDDTTHQYCSDNLPFHWPNTNEPVKSLRMFKAWGSYWTEEHPWNNKTDAWDNLARYLHHSGATVLVGTQVTCDPADDDRDWEDVKAMMSMFGPEAIMGVAVGNEMELLWQKNLTDSDGNDIWNDCMSMLWATQPNGTEPYYQRVFKNRVADLSQMPGFENVPLTAVFGGAIFAGSGSPFVNIPYTHSDEPFGGNRPHVATVLDFLKAVVPAVSDRWKWSLNIYPYFDPGNNMDPDGVHCTATIERGTCFNQGGNARNCVFSSLVADMRRRMETFATPAFGGDGVGGGFDGTLWVGETGWSAPISETLSSPVTACADFSTVETFENYYQRFLRWDMNIPHAFDEETRDFKGPDHVFWFTIRDSSNFDKEEHFGLIGDGAGSTWCTNNTCKLNDRHLFTTTLPYTGPSTTTTGTGIATTTTTGTVTTTTTQPQTGSSTTTMAATTSAASTSASAGSTSVATSATTTLVTTTLAASTTVPSSIPEMV